ncbi:MAG TPA: globin, partial [Flavobacteriaceae bacterium]|nr:globin [Flavobacteriaceae bacterium]
MSKTEIRNREDVNKLVVTFYDSVRTDELLGPIFNSVITDWDEH